MPHGGAAHGNRVSESLQKAELVRMALLRTQKAPLDAVLCSGPHARRFARPLENVTTKCIFVVYPLTTVPVVGCREQVTLA